MDYRALPVFKDAAAWWRPGVNLIDPGLDPVRVNTIEVSGNVFDVLGVQAADRRRVSRTGAVLRIKASSSPSSAIASGARATAPIRRSSAARSTLNGTPYTVVGVMPPKFHYPDDVDVWQRLRWDLHQHSRAAHFMEAVGRLADGTTFDEAQSASRDARAPAAEGISQHQQGLGAHGSCRCSTSSLATTGRR